MEALQEQWQGFWDIVVKVWTTSVFGAGIGDLILGLVIFLVFMTFRRLVAGTILAFLKKVFSRTTTKVDDVIYDAIEGPVKFVPIILGFYFATEALPLSPDLDEITGKITTSLVTFVLFWGLFNLVGPLSASFNYLNKILTSAMIDWLTKGMKGFVILVGGASILNNWGIQVAPILAGLGLFGVAVALGAQDVFKNLFAGLLILAERRFRKGDWIRVDGVVEGTVEHIGFRSTRVRQFDKAPVQVPNAQLSDNPVTNFSEMTFRRIKWSIGVTYSTDIDQLREIRDGIETYILESDEFVNPTEASTFVRIDHFGDSSINLLLYCFTRTTVWGEWLEIKERLAYKVMEVVEGAGSSFAFPSQSLYLETIPSEIPEIFIPPTKKTGSKSRSQKSED